VGLGSAFLTGYCWRLVGGPASFQSHGGLDLLGMLLSLPLLILLHELLHARGHPKFGSARSTVLGVWPSGLTMWAAWLSTWNALCASGDCIGLALMWYQVPPGAIVQNTGWRVYWNARENHAA